MDGDFGFAEPEPELGLIKIDLSKGTYF